jgi:hypothetical protein
VAYQSSAEGRAGVQLGETDEYGQFPVGFTATIRFDQKTLTFLRSGATIISCPYGIALTHMEL